MNHAGGGPLDRPNRLRAASGLRLSNDAFAAHLGIATRTVANWHEKPDLTPRTEIQQLLDTALEQAPQAARSRFATLIADHRAEPPAGEPPSSGQPLTVAIAIVTRESADVLLVQRRDSDSGITGNSPPASSNAEHHRRPSRP